MSPEPEVIETETLRFNFVRFEFLIQSLPSIQRFVLTWKFRSMLEKVLLDLEHRYLLGDLLEALLAYPALNLTQEGPYP